MSSFMITTFTSEVRTDGVTDGQKNGQINCDIQQVYNGQFHGLSTIHRSGATEFLLNDTLALKGMKIKNNNRAIIGSVFTLYARNACDFHTPLPSTPKVEILE